MNKNHESKNAPLFTMVIDPASKDNPYGFEKIHFWELNYDGRGSALVSHDDEADLDSYNLIDVNEILLGNAGHGTRHYHRVL